MTFVITLGDIIFWSLIGAFLLLCLIVGTIDAIIKAFRRKK